MSTIKYYISVSFSKKNINKFWGREELKVIKAVLLCMDKPGTIQNGPPKTCYAVCI